MKSPKYTIGQLNRMANTKKYIVLIQYGGSTFTLERFVLLDVGEDYFDEEEKEEGYSGVNAYVLENGCRFPYEDIENIFVAEKVQVK